MVTYGSKQFYEAGTDLAIVDCCMNLMSNEYGKGGCFEAILNYRVDKSASFCLG
jgi:hypothetical protein